MKLVRNIFAIFGLIAFIGLIYLGVRFWPVYQQVRALDDKAIDTYSHMAKVLLETGNSAEATIVKVKVNPDLSIEDVEDVMKSVAAEHNILDVGRLPISERVENMTGKKQRFVKIYMYCNPITAMQMMDYSDAFSAYLPCRLTLLRDKEGSLWIYSLNMDLMIHGGEPLPDDLKKEAIRVKNVIEDIMNRAATGEF
jgi:uncharacterized protein (DUF302 family)